MNTRNNKKFIRGSEKQCLFASFHKKHACRTCCRPRKMNQQTESSISGYIAYYKTLHAKSGTIHLYRAAQLIQLIIPQPASPN